MYNDIIYKNYTHMRACTSMLTSCKRRTMTKKYLINTYGCQMNVHESEKLAGILEDKGYEACESEDDADVIVFNKSIRNAPGIRAGMKHDYVQISNSPQKGLCSRSSPIVVAGPWPGYTVVSSGSLKSFCFMECRRV